MSRWPMVPLAQVAKPLARPIQVEPGKAYRTIGVKWWGEGAYERQTIDGSETAARTLSLVCEGDLIINKIWVRHGSAAIATKAVAGCAASNEFPTFKLDSDHAHSRWVHWLTKIKWFWNQCDALSMGTSGKNRIKPEKFLTISIPLPPLAEQRRLVKRIDALAAKMKEAKRLRHEASLVAEALMRSSLDQLYDAHRVRFGVIPLADVCRSITDGTHLTPTFEENGVKFILVGNVSSSQLHFTGCKFVSPDYFKKVATSRRPQQGDVLYSAVGATLGIPALVDCDDEFCFQRHVAIIKPDQGKLRSRYLWYVLRSGTLFRRAWSSITGTAQPTIPLKAMRIFPIPVPPVTEQVRVVAYLDELQTKLAEVQRQQATASTELDALLPAILDRAFTGEL